VAGFVELDELPFDDRIAGSFAVLQIVNLPL
jgi:hypothetical protein